MIIGLVLLTLIYVISFILLFHILFCVKYEDGNRVKLPLYEILLMLITFLIPVINIVTLGFILVYFDNEGYEIKSFLTEKY